MNENIGKTHSDGKGSTSGPIPVTWGPSRPQDSVDTVPVSEPNRARSITTNDVGHTINPSEVGGNHL